MSCYNPYGSTPPLDYFDCVPAKNYVQPFSPTPQRSVSDDEDGASRAMASLALNTSFYAASDMSRSSSRSGSGSSSPGDQSPVSSTSSSSSNIYQPARRPYLRSMTSGSVATLASLAAAAPAQYQYASGRPLPPLHRPHPFSTSPRSIDLVTPYMSTASAPQLDECADSPDSAEQVRYEKRASTARAHSGNLKTLFNFDAIRGEPYSAEAMLARSPENYLVYSNGTPILARMAPTAVRMRG